MYKKVCIKSKKDLKKFLKRLSFYNSFLFKKTEFEIIDHTNCLSSEITEILNIKNRKDKLEYIIDTGCNYIDTFFKDKNICGFKNNKCFLQRKNNSEYCNGCCRKCKFQSCNGCTTKNVACKLFFCSFVKEKQKVIYFDDIIIFNCLTPRQKYILKNDYFSKKEDVVIDLYFNSLTIAFARLLFRNLNIWLKSNTKS